VVREKYLHQFEEKYSLNEIDRNLLDIIDNQQGQTPISRALMAENLYSVKENQKSSRAMKNLTVVIIALTVILIFIATLEYASSIRDVSKEVGVWLMQNWILPAVITGLFWGLIALSLYTPWAKIKGHTKLSVSVQQFVLNFFCGFSGWYSLQQYYLMKSESIPSPGLQIFLLLIALFGISGRLAGILWNIQVIITKIVIAILEKYSDTD
jgi:hypothetical protein